MNTSQTKTKPILWTIAALIALSLVAGMVLHKHEEPKVFGNLSKEEVSEISNASLDYGRARVKFFIKHSLEAHDLRALARYIRAYASTKVILIRADEPGTNWVLIGTGKDQIFLETRYIKGTSGWWFSDFNSRGLEIFQPSTNSVPEKRK